MVDRLIEIEERLKAATPGPWFRTPDFYRGLRGVESDDSFVVEPPLTDEDAEFIAAAPSDVAFLLDRVRELEARSDEAEKQLAYIRAGCVNASRDELVRRITAVGTERYKVDDWLAAKLDAARADAVVVLEAQRDKALELHKAFTHRSDFPPKCAECSKHNANRRVEWPCPTVLALGGNHD